MLFRCPGSKYFKEPHPQFINCPHCGIDVEIWTDEIMINCPSCGKKIVRGELPGCLNWCKYAKDCAGEKIYKKYLSNKKQQK